MDAANRRCMRRRRVQGRTRSGEGRSYLSSDSPGVSGAMKAHEDAELRAAERGIPLRRKTSGHGGAEGCRGYPALSRMYYVERWGSVQMKDRQLSPGEGGGE